MGSPHRPRSPRGRRVQAPAPPPSPVQQCCHDLSIGCTQDGLPGSSSSPNHFADTHDQHFRQKSNDASVYAVGWWRPTSRRLVSATGSCAKPCARCVIRVESPTGMAAASDDRGSRFIKWTCPVPRSRHVRPPTNLSGTAERGSTRAFVIPPPAYRDHFGREGAAVASRPMPNLCLCTNAVLPATVRPTGAYASTPTRSMRPPRSPRSLSPTRRLAPRYRNGDQAQPGPKRLLAHPRLAPRPRGAAVGRQRARPEHGRGRRKGSSGTVAGHACFWAIAGATSYWARPRSGRPLFAEALAREGQCGGRCAGG